MLAIRGTAACHAKQFHHPHREGSEGGAERHLPQGLPLQAGRCHRPRHLTRQPFAAGSLRPRCRTHPEVPATRQGGRPHQQTLRHRDYRHRRPAVHPERRQRQGQHLHQRHQARLQKQKPHHKVERYHKNEIKIAQNSTTFKEKYYLCTRKHQEWHFLPTNQPRFVGNGGKMM